MWPFMRSQWSYRQEPGDSEGVGIGAQAAAVGGEGQISPKSAIAGPDDAAPEALLGLRSRLV